MSQVREDAANIAASLKASEDTVFPALVERWNATFSAMERNRHEKGKDLCPLFNFVKMNKCYENYHCLRRISENDESGSFVQEEDECQVTQESSESSSGT
jgi:hypothetical protein